MTAPYEALKGFFPAASESAIQEALRESHGSLDQAASLLLERSEKAKPRSENPKSGIKVH